MATQQHEVRPLSDNGQRQRPLSGAEKRLARTRRRSAATIPVVDREPGGLLASARWAGHQTFTVEEVAEILRLTRWGAYTAVQRGDIPAIRLGRLYRVARRTLAALLGEDA